MRTHVKTLAILEIVYASIGLVVGIGIFLVFGGIATVVGFNAPEQDAAVAIPVLMAIGSLIALVIMALALPRLIAGIGLLQYGNWARILAVIISAIGLVDVPFGTALGIYGLWVLTSREGAALFEPAALRAA